MAKYIRTEKGIYEVLAETGTLYYTDFTGAEGVIKSDKIKQANTIEELCDCFVLVDETLPPHLDTDLKEIKMYKTYISGSRGIIYGAIWTDKGLIYVAKMNENGVLELI